MCDEILGRRIYSIEVKCNKLNFYRRDIIIYPNSVLYTMDARIILDPIKGSKDLISTNDPNDAKMKQIQSRPLKMQLEDISIEHHGHLETKRSLSASIQLHVILLGSFLSYFDLLLRGLHFSNRVLL